MVTLLFFMLFKLSSQQITLHGEGEFPSSPQQILYNVSTNFNLLTIRILLLFLSMTFLLTILVQIRL